MIVPGSVLQLLLNLHGTQTVNTVDWSLEWYSATVPSLLILQLAFPSLMAFLVANVTIGDIPR